MKQKWDIEKLNNCYKQSVTEFADGFTHAANQGIPRFIEEYRISRVKDAVAPWIIEKNIQAENQKKKILDIGCGHGWYPFRLIDKWNFDGHITAVDASEHNIKIFNGEITRRNYQDKISANIANAEALPFPDSTFDTVYSTESLEHIESPAKFFREASRVLKPGGTLIITTPSGPIHSFWKCLFWMPSKIKRIFKPSKQSPEDRIFDNPLSWRQIKSAADGNNLELINYHKSVMLPHESYIQFLPEFIQHLLILRAHLFEKLGPLTQWTGLHHIIRYRKQ